MSISRRFKEAKARVDAAEAALTELQSFFLGRHTMYAAEKHAISTMKRQITAMSMCLEKMIKHFGTREYL